MKTRTVPVNPVRAIRPRANARAIRYWLHVFERPTGPDIYTIRRTHPNSAIWECWAGREQGWRPVTADYVGKCYARHGDAYRTLRKLQEQDRVACTAEGKRRHLERLAPRMLGLLEAVLYDLDEGSSRLLETQERIRATVAVAKRGY